MCNKRNSPNTTSPIVSVIDDHGRYNGYTTSTTQGSITAHNTNLSPQRHITTHNTTLSPNLLMKDEVATTIYKQPEEYVNISEWGNVTYFNNSRPIYVDKSNTTSGDNSTLSYGAIDTTTSIITPTTKKTHRYFIFSVGEDLPSDRIVTTRIVEKVKGHHMMAGPRVVVVRSYMVGMLTIMVALLICGVASMRYHRRSQVAYTPLPDNDPCPQTSGQGSEGHRSKYTPLTPMSLAESYDPTFVGITIPLLQDVTHL